MSTTLKKAAKPKSMNMNAPASNVTGDSPTRIVSKKTPA